MVFFADIAVKEILRLANVLLKATVIVWVGLEAEHTVLNTVHFHIAAVRVAE